MSGSLADFGAASIGSGTVTGTNGPDVLIATGGDATLRGEWGNDTLLGGDGDDSLEGGRISLIQQSDDNLLFGGQGDDTLRGAFGSDTLIGGEGNDWLIPSAGTNLLIGGPGVDTLEFGHGAPATPFRQIGSNTVLGFEPGIDKIDLRNLNYLGGETDLPYRFIGMDAFSGTGPEVRIADGDGVTLVELDTRFLEIEPVDGKVDGVITLMGDYNLSALDLFL
jgi:Ca2+-binding RTX toxin-like protein